MSICLNLRLPCQELMPLIRVPLGLLAFLAQRPSRRLTCLPSLGLHACSMTGDPGEMEVEVAVRHFSCCWMRWSLNVHACKTGTRKAKSESIAMDEQMTKQIYCVFWWNFIQIIGVGVQAFTAQFFQLF